MKVRPVIKDALDNAKVIDPHCHLRPHKPSADNFADLLLYHHLWIELVSSGMGQYEVTKSGFPHELTDPEIEPLERVRRAVKYLKNIKNTTIGVFFKWIMNDLYEIKEELGEHNIEGIFNKVGERCNDPKWQEDVLRNYCGIEYNITVNIDGKPYSDKILKGKEGVPVNIVREYIVSGKENPYKVIYSMEENFGREINNVADYREYLRQIVQEFIKEKYQFAGVWILPSITDDMAKKEEIDRIIKKAKERKPLNIVEIGSFCYFGTVSFLKELRKSEIRTIQILTGAYVLSPHRSITRWNKNFVESIGKIAYEFEDFNINLAAATDIYTQDLGILAKHIPNISVAGYWWHTLYPFYIKKALETRLDMVPLNKIIGFFSDTYHSEWCYPKLKMVKHILEDILVERIEKGWYDVELANDIITKLFYENPKNIYKI